MWLDVWLFAVITGACGPGGSSVAGTGSLSLGKEIRLSAPSCWSYRDRDVRRGECSLWAPSLSLSFSLSVCLSVSLPLVRALALSVLLQCLQMCTNKGGLKQNESKQTNGIRVMGVGGLVHSDKHNDALCVCVSVSVCVSVFLCLGDYQWLGVWCVWLGDCFWVSLCVCLSVCVFVIMCVYIYSVSTCVCDKCFLQCLTKKRVSTPSACVRLYVGVIFPSCLSQCLFVLAHWTSKTLRPILTHA